MGEHTFYVIKPEAMAFSREIEQLLLSVDLVTIVSRQTMFTSRDLRVLYGDLPPIIQKATNLAFTGPVKVGVVAAPSAVGRLLAIAGEATAPAQCAPGTIRYRYGHHEPIRLNGYPYFKNAFHRASTVEEAGRSIAHFFPDTSTRNAV